MEAWARFWIIVLYSAIGLFGILSIWVTIAGIGDIRKMFAALSERKDEQG